MKVWRRIKTETEYQEALAAIDELLKPAELTEEQLDELDLISMLVEKYENEHFPISLPDPIEAIKFRMEQEGLTPQDLEKYIGPENTVAAVLAGKEPLTLQMIRALHEGLGIPADVLLQPLPALPGVMTSGNVQVAPVFA